MINHSTTAPGLGPAPPALQVLKSDVIRPSPRHPAMSSDDEDAEISGDGSGSGEGPVVEDVPQLTNNSATASSASGDQGIAVNLTVDTPQGLVIGGWLVS